MLAGFEAADRGQLIMACGTGKTMVGLWVWEALEVPTALVVLPSLSLLAQTVREWCANARLPFDFLAVCSDESVTDERPHRTPHERAALRHHNLCEQHRRLLGSRPGAEARAVFHLSLDAAHRRGLGAQRTRGSTCSSPTKLTVAPGGSHGGFSMVLKDKQLPSSRRLFMTATPRYLSGG